MISSKIFFKLFPAFLVVSILAMIPVVWFSSHTATGLYNSQVKKELANSTLIVARDVNALLLTSDQEKVNHLNEIAQETGMRLTVITMGGKVVFDSDHSYKTMENHADRPEIQAAFSGQREYAIRYSNTLNKEMMYFASTVKEMDKNIGVMRISLPVDDLQRTLSSVYIKVAIFGIITAFICTFISSLVAKQIVSPLEKLYRGAARYASGDFDKKLSISSSDEIGGVADAVNKMGEQIQKSSKKIIRQNREEKAILKSMREGVIAVSTKMKLIKINKSALSLLSIDEPVHNCNIHGAIRNPVITNFIEKIISTETFAQQDCVLYDTDQKLISMKGTPLTDELQNIKGAVIVLSDVTRIRQLETMRKDFVANVSHELRTPIAAIQGAAETLQDGAIDKREDALFFVNMLTKNCRRLSNLIEDILSLSSVEDGESQKELEEVEIEQLIDETISNCQQKAKEKNITISVDCKQNLVWRINPSLLQQALVNLIVNSIKYSNNDTCINVSAELIDHKLRIEVKDHGFGIEPAEQERIFERFYRVDKSHSTKVEGTGLGLAIVKHIVATHGGEITLKSKAGEGTTFTLVFPVCG